MAVTISDNYQVKYTRKWGTLLQQHASRLDKYVSVMRDLSGKVDFWINSAFWTSRKKPRGGADRFERGSHHTPVHAAAHVHQSHWLR